MLPVVTKSRGQLSGHSGQFPWMAALSLAAGLAMATGSTHPQTQAETRAAEETADAAESAAGELVSEILSGANTSDAALADWTNRIIGEALARTGRIAGATVDGAKPEGAVEPLPAERQAAELAESLRGGKGAAKVLVFLSLAVPTPSWRQWAEEAARAGVPLVLRGPSPDGMRATMAEIGVRLDGANTGVAIDPRLFRLFDIARAPAVVVLPEGVPACASRGCAADAPPPFDRITGNIGLAAALEAVSREGAVGREVARAYLEDLGGRP